jgi:hypothetical protein
LLSGKNFYCKHCGKSFVSERRFMDHRCKQMVRAQRMETVVGQRAFTLYNDWMAANRKMRQSQEAFLSSRYFTSFIKFSEFVQKSKMRRLERFINWTAERNYPPTMWLHSDTLAEWNAIVSTRVPPMAAVTETIDFLFDEADERDVDISEVLQSMTPHEVVMFIKQNLISPWFIFHSSKFMSFIKTKVTGELSIIFNACVDTVRWQRIIQQQGDPDTIQRIKKYIAAMGL